MLNFYYALACRKQLMDNKKFEESELVCDSIKSDPAPASAPRWTCKLCRGATRLKICTGCLSISPNDDLIPGVDGSVALDQEISVHIPQRRTYYYSVFAARLALMVVLAILICLITILTWHFTTLYATKSIKILAFSLRIQLLQRPVSRMWNLLNQTTDTTMTELNLSRFVIHQYSVASDPNGLTNLNAAMKNVTWAIFANRQAVRSISITYEDGHLQAFDRGFKNNCTYYIFALPSNSTQNITSSAFSTSTGTNGYRTSPMNLNPSIWYKEQVNSSTGESVGAITQIPAYDVTGNVSDASILNSGEVLWHVTVNKNDEAALLSSGSPIRDRLTGSLLAVVGVSTELYSVSQLMKDLAATTGGYIYLISSNGLLLATSTESPLVRNSSSGPELVPSTESNNALIRAGAQWLRNKYGDKMFRKDIHVEDVLLNGEKFYIDSFLLNLTELPLVGVILTPRSYVMGEVDGHSHATLAILVSVAICILVVGCLLILVLTSGVSMEMKLRAEVIKHLDARRRAEASNSYKSQFLANMSHELRTPMAAVIGLLDILLGDEDLSAEQISMVSQIRRCSTALLRLLNNILDLSKVESGKLVLEEADFDLRHHLEGLVDMFAVQCLDHELEIILDLADDMPQLIRGDCARTIQIFANLIANSIKFTSSGHIIIRGHIGSSLTNLGAALGEEDAHVLPSKRDNEQSYLNECTQKQDKITLWFDIDDTGCGIDPSKWETIFESFVQADPSTTRTYGGTGLGLCIVRSLVRKMGGDIKVMKKEHAGTLFRLFLIFDHPLETKNSPQQPYFPALLEQSRVLVAMQGNAGRSALAKWISNKGLRVFEASHWDETVAIMREFCQQDSSFQTESSIDEVSVVANRETSAPQECGMHHRHKLLHTFPGPGDRNRLSERVKFSNKLETIETESVEIIDSRFSVPVTSLVIIDLELFPRGMNSSALPWTILDHFRDQGILISWLHSYDTSNSVKMELRKMGYFLMSNKPLYKSKLDSLFMSMLKLHSIETTELHEPNLNLGFNNVHFEARDGLSPGSGMSFNVPRNDNSTSQTQSFQGCNDGSTLGEIVGKDISSRERSDLEERPSSLNKRYPMTSILNNQGSSRSLDNSTVLQPGSVYALNDASGRDEITSITLSRPCGIPSDHQMYLNESCHLNDVEIVSFIDTSVSLYHGYPPSISLALSGCSASTYSKLQLNDTPRQLKVQGADHAQVGAFGNERTLNGSDVSQQIGECRTNSNDSLKAVSDADECAFPRPCKDTPSPKVGETVSSNHNNLFVKCASNEPLSQKIPNSSWREAHQLTPAGSRNHASNQTKITHTLDGIHVLLAEDTPVLQRVATIMLEKMGASVVVVGDGIQAVDALLDNLQASEEQMNPSTKISPAESARKNGLKFDLVLMDCQMPKMDGYDATVAIRNAEAPFGQHTPNIALTAHAMSSDKEKCLKVGMDAYLTKPIDCKLLVKTILALTSKSC